MPVFEYRAMNQAGEAVVGTLHSSSVAAAAEALSQQGLSVEHVGVARSTGEPAGRESADPSNEFAYRERPVPQSRAANPLFGRVALSDLLFFFRQLASLHGAGVNPAQSFHTLAGQTRNENLRAIIREMGSDAEAGRPMSLAMQRHPEVFTPLMVGLVRAGEVGGGLEEILRQVSSYIEQEIDLRRMYRRVTLYPKIVLAASVILFGGTNLVIGCVNEDAQRLYNPLATPAVAIPLIALVILGFLFFRIGLKNPAWLYGWDRFTLSVPAIGKPLRGLAMAKFGRAVGTLYKGGVPIYDAVQLGADACGNQFLRSQIYPVIPRLKEGAGITDTFRATGAFSPIVLDMTQTGEQTGNLDQMLHKMADFYEGETETQTHQLAVVTGVLILLVVAIFVGYLLVINYQNILGGRLSEGLDLSE